MGLKIAGSDPNGSRIVLAQTDLIKAETNKIDNVAVDGLSGFKDSLAYKVNEIEKHLHNNNKIYGLAGTPSGETHRADRITLKPEPFQADAGNDDWGSWLQIFGSSDTPLVAGQEFFDFNKVLVVSHERNTTVYVVQIACGESAGLATKLIAEDFTEQDLVTGGGSTETGPIVIQNSRFAAGDKVWVRIWAKGANTGTLDFYPGIHEYVG